jgi:MFS family permease
LVTAYLLMSGGGLLLGGRIADLLSRRRVLLTGLTVFTTASLVSGFASTAGVLIGARAAQGLGAALMTRAALAIIMTTYATRVRSGQRASRYGGRSAALASPPASWSAA